MLLVLLGVLPVITGGGEIDAGILTVGIQEDVVRRPRKIVVTDRVGARRRRVDLMGGSHQLPSLEHGLRGGVGWRLT